MLYLALEDTPQRARSRIDKLIGNAKLPVGTYVFTEWPRVGDGGLPPLLTDPALKHARYVVSG